MDRVNVCHVCTFAGKVLHNPKKKLCLNLMLYNLTTVQLLGGHSPQTPYFKDPKLSYPFFQHVLDLPMGAMYG